MYSIDKKDVSMAGESATTLSLLREEWRAWHWLALVTGFSLIGGAMLF
jgi:hypothetical protein